MPDAIKVKYIGSVDGCATAVDVADKDTKGNVIHKYYLPISASESFADKACVESSVSSEASRAKEAEETLKTSLATEIDNRESADSTLQSSIDAETERAKTSEKALTDGLSSEASARENADTALQSNINAEVSTRKAVDETLRSNLDAETTRAKTAEETLTAGLSAETTARENADDTLQTNITAEADRAVAAEKVLTDDLASEISAREASDGTLQSNIDAEAATRETNDNALQANIDAEKTRAEGVEGSLQSGIDGINALIPDQATAANQLADKDYVNSSIATSTATFRGTFDSTDSLKALTGDLNDYAFVEVKDGTTGLTLRYDRYKYSETASDETGNWAFEYTLNNSSFTSDQWKSITSGITAELTAQIGTNKADIATLSSDLGTESSAREAGDSDTLTAAKAYTDQEKANYVLKKGDTMTGTLNVPAINNYNVSTAVSIATGTNADSYFQSQKFRGQGNAGTYNHAIDFGYSGHDRVDFYEWGGIWNFWKNDQSTAVTDKATKLALTIGLDSLSNKSYTYTWPNKTGTFALTSDLSSYLPLSGGTVTGDLTVSKADGFEYSGILETSTAKARPVWFAWADSDGVKNGRPAYDSSFTYNPGTDVLAVGGVAAGQNRYFADGKSGIDLNNSDIVRVNAIYTDAQAQTTAEGIRFSRSDAYSASASYDTIVAAGGTLYFKPNDPLEGAALSDCHQVYHTGNLSAATTSAAGLMSASDKSKVDSCGVIWRQW